MSSVEKILSEADPLQVEYMKEEVIVVDYNDNVRFSRKLKKTFVLFVRFYTHVCCIFSSNSRSILFFLTLSTLFFLYPLFFCVDVFLNDIGYSSWVKERNALGGEN